MTANYLSYWTDNGAFYYYHTDQDNNYEDQLQKVAQQDIPFKLEFAKMRIITRFKNNFSQNII